MKFSLFSQKMPISERSSEILRKHVFLNKFEKKLSRRKFGFVVKTLFVQSSKMGEISTKTVFLLKMSHIPPNYTFLFFWSIFGEI